ncbi:MAG: RNA polymerase sigma factor, partial [Gemmataceae bacterium]
SADEREVIELKYWRGQSLEQIAREMDISVTSAFRLLHRAVERVRERIEDE